MSKLSRVYDDLYVGVFGPYAYEDRAMLTSTQVDPLLEEAAITPQQLPLSAPTGARTHQLVDGSGRCTSGSQPC